MSDKITDDAENTISKTGTAKEVSSQIEADYELLKIFMQRGDVVNSLKTVDAIGIALSPDFMNAALLKLYILLTSGREEDAGVLAANMDFFGYLELD